MKRIFITCTVSAFALALMLGMPQVTEAVSASGPAPVQYIISPENPAPNSLVYIEVQGVGTFLGDATITWKKDGKTAASGAGVKTFSFMTGAIGTKTIIDISINSTTYGLISKSFTFNPSFVNLIWEANTTVPPLYEGKALPSYGSQITVYAFPMVMSGGKLQSASSLSYQWRLNGEAMPAQSGLGRSSFTFNNDQLRSSEDVSVDTTYQGETAGHGEITVPIVSPGLVLYTHDPMRGIKYRRALPSSFSLLGTEMTLRAEPYFFSIESGERGALEYSWQLNGSDTSGPNAKKGELTLRKTGEGEGSASLSVSLQNNEVTRLLQGAQSAFTILFTKTSSGSSLFGL